jgi:hypothetical protein
MIRGLLHQYLSRVRFIRPHWGSSFIHPDLRLLYVRGVSPVPASFPRTTAHEFSLDELKPMIECRELSSGILRSVDIYEDGPGRSSDSCTRCSCCTFYNDLTHTHLSSELSNNLA